MDIAVIGAGAAGLAAGRRLAGEAVSHAVLEAAGRIGGRAWTQVAGGWPIDLGCGWLHSADVNPLTKLIESAGLTIDRSPAPWGRQAGDQGFSREEQRHFQRSFAELEARLEAAAEAGGDRPASDLLEQGGPWNALLNAFSAFYNGAEFDEVSVLDYAAYRDTEVNWRVTEGYGAGIARLAAGVEVSLETRVEVIDRSSSTLRIRTDRGVLDARKVIVAVPTTALARERIRFDPPLPEKAQAAADLPLGLADKLTLRLTTPDALPKEGHLFGDIHRTGTGSYHLRPFGRPLIEVFLGGRHAWALEGEGEGAAAAFAIEELTALLGADFRQVVAPLTATRWGADPLIGGSYSHAKPGCSGARAVLAQPVEDRIFFAGEACSANSFSTAHGAWITGEAAAEAALASLRS